MTNKENILRVAKILARTTSSEPHEADVALRAAYKRMRRDHVDVRQLLTLPLEALYQESLTKLVTLILDEQPHLSPPERRKAFKDYMSLITARFNGSSPHKDDSNSSRSTEEDFRNSSENQNKREEEIRQREEETRKRQEESRKRAEHIRQRQEEMRKSEEAIRRKSKGTEHSTDKEKSVKSKENKTKDAGVQSPNSSSQQKKSSSGMWLVASILLVSIFAVVFVKHQKSESLAGRYRTPAAVNHANKNIDRQFLSQSAYSVAAAKANLRFKSDLNSKIKTVLKRGDALTINRVYGEFLEVNLRNGEIGFISKDLVIPTADLNRLLQTTAQSYIARRASEKRVELLFDQAQIHNSSFLDAVNSLSKDGNSVVGYLEKMQSSQQFNIPADMSASIWFSLAANAARSSGNYEKTILEARAAIEADPLNPEHHVDFALDNYRAGNYEVVKSIGNFLPKLAPKSADAWMIFGFANGLASNANNNLTKSAFVLAIKLSENAKNTRKYFREFSVSKYHPNIRIMLDAALMEERENPGIFERVSEIRN